MAQQGHDSAGAGEVLDADWLAIHPQHLHLRLAAGCMVTCEIQLSCRNRHAKKQMYEHGHRNVFPCSVRDVVSSLIGISPLAK